MTRQSHSVVTPPTVEPVSVAEVQAHLRVDSDADEDLVAALAIAAREWCEMATGRQFCAATLRTQLSGFPDDGAPIQLPRAPVSAVTGVTYLDGSGASQTLSASDYVLAADLAPAEISLAAGATWPTTADRAASVTITYTAGYGGPAQVPQPLRAAILLHAQILYDRDAKERESLEKARDSLLGLYRVVYF